MRGKQTKIPFSRSIFMDHVGLYLLIKNISLNFKLSLFIGIYTTTTITYNNSSFIYVPFISSCILFKGISLLHSPCIVALLNYYDPLTLLLHYISLFSSSFSIKSFCYIYRHISILNSIVIG